MGRGAARVGWSSRPASRWRLWSARMPREVVFTSGGTEANVLALSPALGDVLLVSAIEHPSVRAGGRFAAVEEIPVKADGVVDLDALKRRLASVSRPLVSIMLANNETGVVQPVAQAAEIVHAAGGLLHVDAVQGPGRIDCDFKALGADLMTLSAHKIGGPQGAGALIKRDTLDLDAQMKGGGQERGARAGTENVPGIAGFGAAAAAAGRNWRDEAARMASLRDRLESGLKAIAPQAVIFGEGAQPAAQYDPVCRPRREGGDRRDCPRPRGRGGVLGRRLLVGQGDAVPCAGRHGRAGGPDPRGHPPQPGLFVHGSRDRSISKGLG